MPEELYNRLLEYAVETRTSKSQIIRDALEAYLNRKMCVEYKTRRVRVLCG